MKVGEYFRLGTISVQSRKRSTIITILGLSFGLIFLVTVIFITLAAFVSLNSQLNDIRTIATFRVESRNFNDNSPGQMATVNEWGWVERQGVLSLAAANRLKQNNYAKEYLSFNQFGVDNAQQSMMYALDDGEFSPWVQSAGGWDSIPNSSLGIGFKVINLEESGGKMFLDAELEDLGSINPMLAGKKFSAGTLSRGEVIISQEAANTILSSSTSPNYNTLIGRKLTINIADRLGGWAGNVYLDDDTNPDNHFVPPTDNQNNIFATNIITRFTIVGIMDEAVHSLVSRQNSPHIILSSHSLYFDDLELDFDNLLPVIRTQEFEDPNNPHLNSITVITYTQSSDLAQLREFAANSNVMFPFLAGLTLNISQWWSNEMDTSLNAVHLLQAESFSRSTGLASAISSELQAIYPDLDNNRLMDLFTNQIYAMFNILFMALQIVMIVMYTFGGVLFVTSMLNLYNSIHYSVQSRRNYLGMMRAIGTKDSTIPKMYFVEMLIIFLITLIVVAIISFAFCGGLSLTLFLIMYFSPLTLPLGLTLSLNLLYYPVALIMVYSVVFLIALIFALISSRPVARKPILDVLRTEI